MSNQKRRAIGEPAGRSSRSIVADINETKRPVAVASEAVSLFNGDALQVLREMPDCSVDAVVTDPPYGLRPLPARLVADVVARWASGDTAAMPKGRGFLGASWDRFVPPPALWAEVLRVLKPGGHALVFAAARTQDLMGLSLRLAGFEVRDTLMWTQGQGFPKSHDISRAIDRKAGERTSPIGARTLHDLNGGFWKGHSNGMHAKPFYGDEPVTEEARRWDGWGTGLKPAYEPILLVRKPFKGTVASNILEYGAGGINVDGCRVGDEGMPVTASVGTVRGESRSMSGALTTSVNVGTKTGRWPSNFYMSHGTHCDDEGCEESCPVDLMETAQPGAAKFFAVSKARLSERVKYVDADGVEVTHPTQKPLELMRNLVRLVTPPGGVLLEPFAGSGTTIEAALLENTENQSGFHVVAAELTTAYIPLIQKRVDRATGRSTGRDAA